MSEAPPVEPTAMTAASGALSWRTTFARGGLKSGSGSATRPEVGQRADDRSVDEERL